VYGEVVGPLNYRTIRPRAREGCSGTIRPLCPTTVPPPLFWYDKSMARVSQGTQRKMGTDIVLFILLSRVFILICLSSVMEMRGAARKHVCNVRGLSHVRANKITTPMLSLSRKIVWRLLVTSYQWLVMPSLVTS